MLNKTEDSLKELFDLNKTEGAAGVIHNVFDAKRTVVAAKKDALNVNLSVNICYKTNKCMSIIN